MASTGQIFGAAIGFVVGGLFGFGMGGMAIGGMIGLWLDPADPPDPPELGDLGCNSYVRNMPVPILYGKDKVYGGIIWIGNNSVEMENEGSSKSPSYAAIYSADFAVAISEGPIRDYINFFINEKSIDEVGEEDSVYLVMQGYNGTSDQTIDPIIETNLSGTSTPAIPFKYTAYLVATGKIGKANSLPTFAVETQGILSASDGEGTNTVQAIYDFLTNIRYGCGIDVDVFDGSPYTTGSWKTESDYCDGAVSIDSGTQARFRYSHCINNRSKAFDILSDMLQSCRGFIYYSEGLLKITIAKASEDPIFYFSEKHEVTLSTGNGCTVNRIYADFTEYPHNYWNGDIGYIEINGSVEEFIVLDTDPTYIDLVDNLSDSPGSGIDFTIEKQNITKDSFSYGRKGTRDKYNRTRMEFRNHADQYRTDYVEVDNVYDINETNEIRTQTISINGIKRKEQAARMATFFNDFSYFVEYTCEFQTDILGYMFTIGDIIGLTETVTGWDAKLFRIIGLEELEDWNVKVSCLEYIPDVFHDSSDPVEATPDFNFPNPYTPPENVERLKVYEDFAAMRIYITFKRTDGDVNWVGGVCYLSIDGGEYNLLNTYYSVTPSVKLNAAIDDAVTTIAFDPTTVYGSFPLSGSFWIDEEEISYTGIDDDTDEFTGCTRAFNSTTAASHLATAYCALRKSSTPYYTYASNHVGSDLTFKIVSVNAYDIYSDALTAPTDTITVQGT